ncbi:hypothetical protein PATSB16_41990 [Pandoraea thiooxydans]|nr:hypothetical protein PATSB16_41990 [Pandoraea thiooxydans]
MSGLGARIGRGIVKLWRTAPLAGFPARHFSCLPLLTG